jgi:hypothetical protein
MYTKINVSKVLELRADLGLIVEVNQGTSGKPNDIVLWLQYKDDAGQWQYKGSKGATGIRIPIVDGLEKFLLDTVKASIDASNKFNASNKAAKGKIDINALSEDMKADLLKALLQAGKAETKEEPAITLENVLSLLSPTKETKKDKKTKK